MKTYASTIIALGLLFTGIAVAAAAEVDPSACVQEIQRVCVNLDDKLETCLADRGNQLSQACRDQMKSAMSMMKDPTGPAACVPDVQRLCAGVDPKELAGCITEQQKNFSQACRDYLQSPAPKPAAP